MQTTYKIPNAQSSFSAPTAASILEEQDEWIPLTPALRRAFAYHEASHMAAYAFLGHDWDAIVKVTLESNGVFDAYVRRYGVPIKKRISTSNNADALAAMEAICAFAGPIGEAKFTCEEFVVDLFAEFEIDEPGTDMNRIGELADMMTRKYHPKWPMIYRWADLAGEVLEAPGVWECVEDFAEHLLEVKTVYAHELPDHFRPIVDGAKCCPKWRRRLGMKRQRIKTSEQNARVLSISSQQ